ncbi:MAG: Nif3-like dinuclear metal center hexameric protein [Geobacteraceae bacterium]|nr:Nif3-like dinuclear metal center hexameric protein [Geobacteraceae bacterium]
MQAKLSDIIGIINKIAPPSLAEDWDNVGLQVGDPSATIDRIMVALDPVQEAIDAAIDNSCQLLLTHHPLIFKPLKRISTADETGRLIHKAIANRLAIVSLHTNYDVVQNGVNDLLTEALGMTGCKPLKVSHHEELVKLVVFVPLSHHETVMNSLIPFCCQEGNYADCSFTTSGLGTFRPLDGSSPYIGTTGKRECVEESRIELLITKTDIQAALKSMRRSHPYEEPAFDIIPLLNKGKASGIGRIGNIATASTLKDFSERVKVALGTPAIRIVGNPERLVSKIAVCGGSGAFLLRDAAREGADLLLTGDIKYHEAREAGFLGIALIDAGHFPTEKLMIEGLSLQLEAEIKKRRLDVQLCRCTTESDPFRVI